MTNKILKLPEVMNKTGLSRSTIYDLMAKRLFPKSVKLGERAVGWLEAEVDGWIESKIMQRSAI